MGVDATRPTFNFEPKYTVTISHREDWTKGPGAPPEVKGLVCFTDGSKMKEGTGPGVYGKSVKRRLSFSLGRYATVFQAEIYGILACVNEIQSLVRPEKHASICSDSQAVLKSLQATRTTSLLVQQCQKALNDISTRYVVGLFWVPGHAGIRGNEVADELARGGSVRGFLGPEPALGVSRRDVQHRLNRWLINQQWARWRDPGSTQRQARELISGHDLDAKAKLMSFSRTQSRVVIGLLTGHNTLRRQLHLLGLADSPLFRRCGAEEETSAHILCECEALASLRHAYLRCFFLEPEDIKSISLGAIWNFSKAMGLP
jgi:ribonuclease HI